MRTPAAPAPAWALLVIALAASVARGEDPTAGNTAVVTSRTTVEAPNVTSVLATANGTLAPTTGIAMNSSELPPPVPAKSTVHPTTAGPEKPSTARSTTPFAMPNGTVNATTVSPGNSSTTPAHAASTAASGRAVPSGSPGSSFDMVSFVGGVALAVGLQALLFFAYKYFRTRNPRYQHLGDTDAII